MKRPWDTEEKERKEAILAAARANPKKKAVKKTTKKPAWK